MLCRNVNRVLEVIAIFFLSFPAFAAIPVERTIVAYYDLANHRSEHHEMTTRISGQQTILTFTPIDATSSAAPSRFTVSSCVSSELANVKRGLLVVTAEKTDANDSRLSNVGDFFNDHNLRGAWIPLNPKQYLFFSPETEGMMVMDTIPSMNRCR